MPLFELQSIGFSYGDTQVLRGVSAVIEPSRFVTLIGPNGAGKTTLLHLLGGSLAPGEGAVLFQGRPLGDWGPGDLSRQLALVPQEMTVRFPFTCLEVVLMGRTPFSGRMSRPSAEDLDLVRGIMRETDTVDFAAKPVTELSGGEKQRVVLAKALAQAPRVLLLDEPFSSMDMHYAVRFLKLLRSKVEQDRLTVIAVMHDLHLASLFSDQVVALDRGRVSRNGPPGEVLDPGFIRSLFHVKVARVGARGLVVLPEL